MLDLDSDELYGKRNSRYEVTKQILTDLDGAIAGLPYEQNISAADKGHLSKQAAQAFKARVLLHEATWIKYVGTTTDGDGTTNGSGSEGYDASVVSSYLKEAAELAEEVMNSGAYELFNHNDKLTDEYGNGLSMLYLFNLEDSESNPAGLDKSDNREFIIYNVYDYNLKKGGVNVSHTVPNYLAPSRKFMDMFLCQDGLPVDKSLNFLGYTNTSDEYMKRDYRLVCYVADVDKWQIPEDNSVTLVGSGTADPGAGYYGRKFRSYNYLSYRTAETESSNYCQLRLGEVFLIYAEALFELNGTITDEQLNKSINNLRKRAGVRELTNSFVSSNGLDMLTEIRRERTVELYAENDHRFNDLKRWGIAEEELNQAVCGAVVEGTAYETNGQYNPTDYVYGTLKVSTGKGELNAILLDPAVNRNFKRTNYLHPLPLDDLELNPNLLQNPGY